MAPPSESPKKSEAPDLKNITDNLSTLRKSTEAWSDKKMNEVRSAMKSGRDAITTASADALDGLRSELKLWEDVYSKPEVGEEFSKELRNQVGLTTTTILEKWKTMTVDFPATAKKGIGGMMEFVSKNFEYFQNTFAYKIAPFLEKFGSIQLPFFGDLQKQIAMATSFLGMDKVMLFSSMRSAEIDPVFNTKNPAEDTAALRVIMTNAKKVLQRDSAYTLKDVLNDATTNFKETLGKNGRKTFSLKELATFLENPHELEKIRTNVENAPKITPDTKAPETKDAPVTVAEVGGKLEVTRGEKKWTIETLQDGTMQCTSEGERRIWKLVQTVNNNETPFSIPKLNATQDGSALVINIPGMPYTFKKEQMQKLVDHLKSKESFSEFDFNGVKLPFILKTV